MAKVEREGAMNRRGFLKTVGGAGAVATAGAVGAVAPAAAAESEADKKKARYRETDHVKNYYRVNRYPSN